MIPPSPGRSRIAPVMNRKPNVRPILWLLLGLAGCTAIPPSTPGETSPLATRHMIAAAHPLAASAGRDILRAGGSAIDAAIAAQFVLGLAEPQSSGIGGGLFLLHFERASGRIDAFDGRETAPAGLRRDLFRNTSGLPLGFEELVATGRSVGVPGALAALELAHRAHGKLPWARLFDPAIALAETGFAISDRLAGRIAADAHLPRSGAAARYFLAADGRANPAGTMLRNPDYAATLRAIAAGGATAFYTGPIAGDIVAAVANDPRGAGALGLADLTEYRAQRRTALCAPYRAFRVCGMPPPSSGGLAVLQILGMLERFDMRAMRPNSLIASHAIVEASRLAFADRNAYVGDPEFVTVPTAALIDRGYLAQRAQLIRFTASMGRAFPGVPPRSAAAPRPAGAAPELAATSHVSVVDEDGNAVAMTSSIEGGFGARLMVRGFLLNNQLTDFDLEAEAADDLSANRAAPGKRPRSSMAPTLVFDRDGALVMTMGSPGGSRIIGFVAKSLIAALDWGMSMQAAIDAPHILNRNGPTEIEADTALEDIAPALEALGHEVRNAVLRSGLTGIRATARGYQGGADRRGEGAALGD